MRYDLPRLYVALWRCVCWIAVATGDVATAECGSGQASGHGAHGVSLVSQLTMWLHGVYSNSVCAGQTYD